MQHIIVPEETYFITTVTLHRRKVFWHEESPGWKPIQANCDVVVHNLDFYRQKFRFQLHGYVIMPDHIHLLLTPSNRGMLTDILRDFKHRVATEMNAITGQHGTFWQANYYEHGIRSGADFREKLAYIHNNPVRAGLLGDPLSAWYSSVRAWETGEQKPLRIDFID